MVHERKTIRIQERDLRKSCPTCGTNLLTKINSLPPERDDAHQNGNNLIPKSTDKNEPLTVALENDGHVMTGDRVVYKCVETGYENCGTVTRVLVEIRPDKALCSNAEFNNTVKVPMQHIKDNPQNSDDSTNSSDSGICDSHSDTSEEHPISAEPKCKDHSSNLRPKWIAGDRIYLPKENKYAKIKWIGSRQFTFMTVIEYDTPVGDAILDFDDLPFSIKPENLQKQRRLTLDELNECAQKASNSGISSLFSRFRRWGSERLTTSRFPGQLSIESQTLNKKNVLSRPTSISSNTSFGTNSLMSIAEFKININEKLGFLKSSKTTKNPVIA